MDIKIEGITEEMKQALQQAGWPPAHPKEMAHGLTAPREELSGLRAAPADHQDPPGQDPRSDRQAARPSRPSPRKPAPDRHPGRDGTIVIASVNAIAAQAASARIEQITSDVEPGRIYEGKVAKIMDFGAFVTILPGKDGLVHVSQISSERVEKVGDVLKEGDVVKVKVLEVDKQGRIRLSMKAVEEGEGASAE